MIALYIFIFAVLYAVKGGQHKFIPGVTKLRKSGKVWDRLLDGKTVSTLGAFLFGLWILNPLGALFLAFAWLIAVAPSVGEEIGAVGGYRGGWGPYLEKGFGRSYGAKKAAQRGVWMGAAFALALGSTWPVLTSLLFVPCVWFGVSIEQFRHERVDVDWHIAEILVGGLCIGLGVYLGAA
jgi:hypothetical protein